MLRALLVAAAVAASHALLDDTLVLVTDNGSTGSILTFDMRNRIQTKAISCPQPFTGATVYNDVVYAVSRTNVHRLPLSNGTRLDCTLAQAVLPDSNTRVILHAEVDDSDVYWTEDSTYAIMRAPLDGSTAPSVFMADGGDGVNGPRLALSLWEDTVIYSTNGVNASDAGQPMRTVMQAKKDGSASQILFRYPTQPWWVTESAISPDRQAVILAEYRNQGTPTTTNMQRLDLSGSWGSTGGLTILGSNLAQGTTDTFITLDGGAAVAWWTPPHSNLLSFANITARNSPPLMYDALSIPNTWGMVHGIHFVPGTGAEACYRMAYPASGTFPTAPVSCAGASPTPRSGAQAPAAALSVATAAVVAAGAALLAARY